MENVMSAIRRTIPISLFNRGQAGKIFSDVKKNGTKVVMKNNTAECVLLSPEEYTRLMEEVENARLMKLAAERLEQLNPAELVTAGEVNRECGISEADLADCEEVELE